MSGRRRMPRGKAAGTRCEPPCRQQYGVAGDVGDSSQSCHWRGNTREHLDRDAGGCRRA